MRSGLGRVVLSLLDAVEAEVEVGGAANVCMLRIPLADRPFVYPIVERDAALAAAARIVEALLGTVGAGAGFGRERNDGLGTGLEVFGWRGAVFKGADERTDAALRELIVPGPLFWRMGFLTSDRGLREVGCGFMSCGMESGVFLLRRCRNVSGTSPTVQSSSIIFIIRSSAALTDR